jgi:TetR/AcrR family transcriptional repressor of nem operon
MAASASEIGRHDTALSHHYAEGYMGIVRAFERHITQQEPGGDALARAMVAVAALIGGLAVARGAAKGNPAVSEQVLKATREMIDVLIQAGGSI